MTDQQQIITPGGRCHPSRVHQLEPGDRLDAREGRLRVRSAIGRVRDLAELKPPVAARGRSAAAQNPGAMGEGWIAYAGWPNTSGAQITSFRTSWVVPEEPETTNGQLIYLFNGLQDTPVTMILQPVLQWGDSPAGGGRHWAVASWAVFSSGDAVMTKLDRVKPGDTLTGVMTLESMADGVYTWTCEFEGLDKTVLPFVGPQQLDWCAETLEAYDVSRCSDYPDAPRTRFKDISIRTGATRPDITWTAYDAVNGCGQSAVVVSDSAVQGEVDISYRDVPNVRPWPSVGGTFPDGAPVAAVARDADHLDLFICGNDGKVYTAGWAVATGWSSAATDRWSGIGGTFPAGAPVSAVARSADHLDLFICGNDGKVYTAWWRVDSGWSSAATGRWTSIGGTFPAGAQVTALSRDTDSIDLFICGTDGHVYTSFWRADMGWSSLDQGHWLDLGGTFPDRAPITATTRTADDMDLFICGNDGKVYTSFYRSTLGWSSLPDKRWSPIGGTFPDGAPIAAVSRAANTIDLFGCGADGDVYMNSWRAGDGWSSAKHGHWASIGGTLPYGAPPAATSRTVDDMDVFICGNDGKVYTASYRAGDGWSSAGDGRWSPLGAVLPAGAPVTAVARDDDHLDLFGTGIDGRVGADSWHATTGWTV